MIGEPLNLRATVLSAAALGLLLYGCQLPEAFHADLDAAVVLPESGTGGVGQPGDLGGMVGSGGALATGGAVGTGGRASSGGSVGAGAAGSGGAGATGATVGQPPGGSGGAAGTGGGTASGGAASGGAVGSGGSAGTAAGGATASGGASGGAGTGGNAAGSSGGGHAGTGAAGSAGSGGIVGTNPCAGLCTNPKVFTTKMFSSGNLGTGVTCHETTAGITSGNCSNFTSRTFKINDTAAPTSGANWPSLPPKRNGGYCFQASAGTPDFAAFVTF